MLGGNGGSTNYPDNTYGPVIYGEGNVFDAEQIDLKIKSKSGSGTLELLVQVSLPQQQLETLMGTATGEALFTSTGDMQSSKSDTNKVTVSAGSDIDIRAEVDVLIEAGNSGATTQPAVDGSILPYYWLE